jgi:hypothetical protein
MYWMWKGIQLYVQSEDSIEEQTGRLTPYYKDNDGFNTWTGWLRIWFQDSHEDLGET